MTIALFDIQKQVSDVLSQFYQAGSTHATQLTRYWTHHSHPVTRLVHALTIPFLFWCVLEMIFFFAAHI